MKLEYLKDYWCSIVVYDQRGKAYGRIEFMIWEEMRLDHLTRWNWYFEYRAALLKVKYPRCKVILSTGQSAPTTKTLENFYKDKIAGKKRMITKLSNALSKYENELLNTSLFGVDNEDELISKAKTKISKYKIELKELEEEYDKCKVSIIH